jgi:hypothetical protein
VPRLPQPTVEQSLFGKPYPRVGISLSARSIVLTQTLLLLAGVLLGKASLDWLYGLTGELPQAVPQFGDPDSAGIRARGGAE